MKRAALWGWLTALLCVQLQLVAAAQEPELDEARERFQRGVKLYEGGSFDAALAEFNKAYELAPNYRVLYNLARVQVERHDSVAALRLFKEYLEQGGSKIALPRRKQVERELVELRARVADLWVRANVQSAELIIDGASAGQLPLQAAVLVSSGVHQIQLRKAGYETYTRNITIAGNETRRIELFMQPETRLEVASPPPTAVPLESPRPREEIRRDSEPVRNQSDHAPLWLSLISTGLLAGGAVTFALLTHTASEKLDAELNHYPSDADRIDSARSTLRCNAILTDGFSAAALVMGGFSLYFTLSNNSQASNRDSAPTVKIGPAGLGMRMHGDF